jgi:DNA polymerase-3 subunit alpha
MKVKVNLPDINQSNYKFLPLKENLINYGLGAIKGVGESAAYHIEEVRLSKGKYINIEDFCSKVNLTTVNSGAIEALVSSGCFDSISIKTRTKNLVDLQKYISQGHKKQIDKAAGQNELFTEQPKTMSNEQSILTNQLYKPTNNELIKERKVL